jgi:hypothetical protein
MPNQAAEQIGNLGVNLGRRSPASGGIFPRRITSYLRIAKRAAIMVGRYSHAHQFKRADRKLGFLRTRLGRLIRDIKGSTEPCRDGSRG